MSSSDSSAFYDPATGPSVVIPAPSAGDETPPPHTFEIGLVLAGAVSAGAYTGGVLDYLFEALDAFTEARRAPGSPIRHDVVVRVISGASAGGITGAIAAAAAAWDFPHIRNDQDAAAKGDRNPFYAAWVKQIDMRPLLGREDLAGPGPLRSVLDCTVLDQIVTSTLSYPQGISPAPAPISRPWLGTRLKLGMSVTNLRGISYEFPFPGRPGSTYPMTRHNDVMRFSLDLGAAKGCRPDEIDLATPADPTDAGWAALGCAALATASFPLALRAQTVRPKPALYDATWFVDYGKARRAGLQRFEVEAALRHLDSAYPAAKGYSYVSADGGIIDNDPLEMARVELAGIMGHNPRDAAKACRAVILVDPFPDPPGDGTLTDARQASIFQVAAGVVMAMKNQGRFDPDAIRLALDPDVYSRFMISPSRDGKTGGAALASGAIGGFSGFLDESFRHHDFMLGRINCHKFLHSYFRIPFATADGPSWLFAGELPPPEDCQVTTRAIIPVPDATEDYPAWPFATFKPSQLRGAIARRIDAIGAKIIAATPSTPLRLVFQTIWGAGLAGGLIRRQVTDLVVKALADALVKQGLLPAAKDPGQ